MSLFHERIFPRQLYDREAALQCIAGLNQIGLTIHNIITSGILVNGSHDHFVQNEAEQVGLPNHAKYDDNNNNNNNVLARTDVSGNTWDADPYASDAQLFIFHEYHPGCHGIQ
ncbi:hypothetical protein PG994_010486 [Apiospora phragmitis]|uniref:Uncharacterized protein n=1 Tax=Apiospora phragmitis TaxID=2905665 RepID=A0ABR1TS86_9PEZI